MNLVEFLREPRRRLGVASLLAVSIVAVVVVFSSQRPAGSEKRIELKPSHRQCSAEDASGQIEWHFVINQIRGGEEMAPPSITARFRNAGEAVIPRWKFSGSEHGGTAHYTWRTDSPEILVTAETWIYREWSGEFNVSSPDCQPVPATPVATRTPTPEGETTPFVSLTVPPAGDVTPAVTPVETPVPTEAVESPTPPVGDETPTVTPEAPTPDITVTVTAVPPITPSPETTPAGSPEPVPTATIPATPSPATTPTVRPVPTPAATEPTAQRPTAATTATAVVVSPPSPAALPTATPVSEAAAGEMVPTPPGASPAASPSLVLVETTSPAGSVLPTTGHPVAFLSWILLAVGAFFAAAGALLEYRRGSGRAG